MDFFIFNTFLDLKKIRHYHIQLKIKVFCLFFLKIQASNLPYLFEYFLNNKNIFFFTEEKIKMEDSLYCLKWDEHASTFCDMLCDFREKVSFVIIIFFICESEGDKRGLKFMLFQCII